MIGHVLMYFLLVLILLIFNIINHSFVPFLLSLIFIVITIFSLAIVILLRMNTKVAFEEENSVGERTNRQLVRLVVTNTSFIPLLRCKIYVEIKHGSNSRRRIKKIKTMCMGNSSQICEFYINCPDCETISLRIKKFYVYDFMGLLMLRRKSASTNMLIVMPHTPDIDILQKMAYVITNEESMIYSDKKPGDDPTEIFAIREYKGGDKIRNIHWKLSSKTSGLMVKDYGLPLMENDTVIIDIFQYLHGQKNNRNEMFDLFYGLVNAMTRRGYGFNACIYDGTYHKIRIETQSDIYNLFSRIYTIKPYPPFENSAANMFYSEQTGRQNRIFYVTGYLDDNTVGQMRILKETGFVYYLIPGHVYNSYMPVKFEG